MSALAATHIDDPDFETDGHWRTARVTWSEPGLDRDRLCDELERQVARLPAMQARAYRMRELQGIEPPAICAALGIDEGELFALLHNARLTLRRALFR